MQGRGSQGARKDGCTGGRGVVHAELPGERGKGLCTGISLRYGEVNQCVGRLILVC
jgi:hypothetical protein